MRDTYTNRPKGHKVLGLIFIGQEIKVIRRGTEPVGVFTFRHKDMPNIVMCAAKRYVNVTFEEPPEYFSSIENETRKQHIKQKKTP